MLSSWKTAFSVLGDPQQFLKEAQQVLAEIKAETRETERDTLFYSVGVALTTWAKMEEGLVMVVRLLLGVSSPQAGVIMYSIVNFNAWLGIINDLFALQPELSHFKPQWNKISADLRKIKDDRDRLAHNAVAAEINSEAVIESRALFLALAICCRNAK